MKANKLETVSFCWRKRCPDVNDLTGFETIKEIMNDIVDKAKKLRRVGEVKVLILGKLKS